MAQYKFKWVCPDCGDSVVGNMHSVVYGEADNHAKSHGKLARWADVEEQR